MSEKLSGIDVSKWQGEMDWQKAVEAGARFAFIRAGSIDNSTGKCYIDYQFYRNATFGPELVPVGYYWFFRPNHSPTEQADYFANLINQEDWLIPPVADIENNGGLSPAAYADAVKEFLDRLAYLTTSAPIIYTSNGKWAQVEPRVYWPIYDLWVANYTDNPDPLMPEGWSYWHFWQYSKKGDGAKYGAQSAEIDLNWFNGSEEEFHQYLNLKPPMPKIVEITATRNAVLQDSVQGDRISILPLGLRLAVVGSQEDDDGKLWYDVGGYWLLAGYVQEIEPS